MGTRDKIRRKKGPKIVNFGVALLSLLSFAITYVFCQTIVITAVLIIVQRDLRPTSTTTCAAVRAAVTAAMAAAMPPPSPLPQPPFLPLLLPLFG